ncbi:mannose-1-phosphate guanylyltransferase [Clostridiales bacterium]|nr:mannose-1-phosphate guanylyltransferase [Clostridiales bacterium]
MRTTALIMAGGRGERFWPKSRKNTPKQFLCLTNSDRTMIQSTVDRILPMVQIEDIYIVTNRAYKGLVQEQLPELPEENILCEPVAKNTAPCIGWGAAAIRKKYGDAMMLVLPSDHLILQPHIFRNVLKSAISVAEETSALVTLGIAPTVPDTGYGYIQYDTEGSGVFHGVFRVKCFVEKPDMETAKKYLASGEYLWNSGMFIWKASTVLREMETFLPDNYALLTKIEEAIGTEQEEAVLEDCFSRMEPISIDYGVMERAKEVYVLPASFGWDDVGSWLAVGRINPSNDMGNVIKGDVVTVDSTRCIVQGGDKTIAMVGLEDTIIVDTKDALLVCAKDSAGEIRKVLEILRAVNRTELL